MRTQAFADQAFVRTAVLTCEQLLSKNYRLRHFLKKVLATYIDAVTDLLFGRIDRFQRLLSSHTGSPKSYEKSIRLDEQALDPINPLVCVPIARRLQSPRAVKIATRR